MTEIILEKNEFTIGSLNIRDNIIYTIKKELSDTHFAEPLIRYLELMKKSVLDSYSTINLILSDYNITLHFQTSSRKNRILNYRIDDLGQKPKPEFLSKWNNFYKHFKAQIFLEV